MHDADTCNLIWTEIKSLLFRSLQMYYCKITIIVKPSLMATTLHNGHLSSTAYLCPGGQSINCFLFKPISIAATSLQWQRPLKRVPNCQNNLSRTDSFISNWWKSQECQWNLIRMAFWLLITAIIIDHSIYTAALSVNNCLQYLLRILRTLLALICMYDSKHC